MNVSNFEYKGKIYKVILCDGAAESLMEALCHFRDTKKKSLYLRLLVLVKQYADGEQLSPNTMKREDIIVKGKYFYVIKKIPIRIYFWKESGYVIISHFKRKLKDKLDAKDTTKVRRNWKKTRKLTCLN